MTLKCKISTLQYPEYKSAERRVDKTISQWKKGIAEQQSRSGDCRSSPCPAETCVHLNSQPLSYLSSSVSAILNPLYPAWIAGMEFPNALIYLFVYLFAVTSKSGRKSEGAVDQSLLDTVQISWIVQAYFIVTCSQIHPWKSCGVWISSSWFGFHSCFWKFWAAASLDQLSKWGQRFSLPKSLKELRSQCDLCWCCCCLREDFEVWSQHYVPNSSGGLWLRQILLQQSRQNVMRQLDSCGNVHVLKAKKKKAGWPPEPTGAILCPAKHKSNTYIVAFLVNFSQPAWNMWLFGMWGKAA